jgi:hypothetical protein
MRKILGYAAAVLMICGLVSAPAFAQVKGEVSGTIGWTFADGVSFSSTLPVNGYLYNRADPKDSVSYGLAFGVYVNPEFELEFMYNYMPSKLEVTGNGPAFSTNMGVSNYHGNFVFNALDEDAKVRPFFYIGLGATSFHDAIFPQVTVPGATKFSWAVGAGVKAFMSPHAGIRAGVHWVPTYIKTDGVGWWCDPYWGCAPVGNVQYATQVELSGGVVFRFDPEPQPVPEP